MLFIPFLQLPRYSAIHYGSRKSFNDRNDKNDKNDNVMGESNLKILVVFIVLIVQIVLIVEAFSSGAIVTVFSYFFYVN